MHLGGLEFVNNAGVGVIKPLTEMDLTSFEQVFATNVTGAMLMAREAAKHFIERRRGHRCPPNHRSRPT